MKISKTKTKTIVEEVEEEVKETKLEGGVRKYVRTSTRGYWVVRTEKGEAFCCLGLRLDKKFESYMTGALAEGDTKERGWLLITTDEVVMLDAVPYSHHPSWQTEEQALKSLKDLGAIEDLDFDPKLDGDDE